MDKLTVSTIRAAQPRSSSFKLYDGRGLFLLIKPNGRKFWRFRYKFGGRENQLSFGSFPEITLKRAREKRSEARVLLDRRLDPSDERRKRREEERAAQFVGTDSFEYVAIEYFAVQAGGRQLLRRRVDDALTLTQLRGRLTGHLEEMSRSVGSEAGRAQTHKKALRRLERFVFPYLGRQEMRKITTQQLQRTILRIDERGTHETARRTLSICRRIWRYAMSTFRAESDPSTFDANAILSPTRPQHFAAITEPKRVGEFLRAINGYSGEATTAIALRLLPLVFVRPGELRRAQWREFDFENAEWRIQAERMKSRKEHLVPLSRQALHELKELRPLTGDGEFVFPSVRSNSRTMSENTLGAALRRLGYTKNEMVAHGFRSTASTLLHELGWPSEVIELQLAHQEANTVKRAYNRSQRFAERVRMMQQWADYLDALRDGSNVTAFRRSA